MAAGLWTQPSLEFGVKVVRVAGLDLQEPADERRRSLDGGSGTLFVRYYVPAGDGARRLRVDTREVPCCGGGGEAFWGELARFERWGRGAAAGRSSTPAAAAVPSGGGVVFEVRWRPPPSSSSRLVALLGMNSKGRRPPPSRVMARAELAWQDAAASSKPAEKWLTLSPASSGRELSGCIKAPKLLVEVDVVTVHAAVAGGLHVAERKAGDTCCSAGEHCGQCGWVGSEEDMFLAATFGQ